MSTPALLVVLLIAGWFICASGPRAQEASGTSPNPALRTWETWKALSEAARIELAPKLVRLVGQVPPTAALAVESVDNTSRYRALCARRIGAFRTTPLCHGLQYRLGERSAWSTTFLALERRAGTVTANARDAAAILNGLRDQLGLANRRNTTRPQHLLRGLYDTFGKCAPPACEPGLVEGSPLKSWLTAAARYASEQGNDSEAASGKALMALGWR